MAPQDRLFALRELIKLHEQQNSANKVASAVRQAEEEVFCMGSIS